MILMEGLWSCFLFEIIDCVLFFLLVFVLCRFWCVCRRWNVFILKLSFYDLCDFNGRKEIYLFVMWYFIYSDWCYVDFIFIWMMCFFDLDVRWWYFIKVDEYCGFYDDLEDDVFFVVYDIWIVVMDDGFVCDLIRKYDILIVLVVFDLIV